MSRYQPALLGGLFIGVLSALPVVNWANLCCCAWVVAGGVLTSYLLQQNRAVPIDTGEAALQGLLAGCIGSLIYLVLTAAVLTGLAGGDLADQVRRALEENPQVPPDMRDRFVGLAESGALMIVVGIVTIPVMAVFGLLGGLLGAVIFRRGKHGTA